ncbi:cytochrome C biogenesis protein [Anaerovibrio sp.]|uniref:cytochrome C biogenesis protein n=1 Tax=Anaerovibrio sp. TaxID=1872532 RepID=UPI001B6E0080|nr:cytochrome C biogenesis protein [Anaerovibrio sp.]MBP3231029.1 cytochrome C biogenesis protein [Anaerovibrio sp.]MBR2142798.1 cytochrome C biogenesis protein [Anaerovibrio sp.]
MELFKLEIYIPESHLKDLQKALQSSGAGRLGNYEACLAYSRVKGTWKPLDGARPYIGEVGALSVEDELKVEVNVDKARLRQTIQAIRDIHPYEEPLINVISLYDDY